MKLLLDTCALLALAGQTGKLSCQAARVLTAPERVCASPISAWEIAIKSKAGKLLLACPPEEWFRRALDIYQIEEIPLATRILCAAAELPAIHRDPFDRVLVATAIAHDLTLLTADRDIPSYPGVKAIW